MSPSNLSSHVPITSTANLLCIIQVRNTAEYGDVITNRVNWQKCHIAKYHIFFFSDKFKSLDIKSGSLDQQFENVAHIFKSSAEVSTVVVKKRRVRKLRP